MINNTQIESHHGVLMRINGQGVLIIGPAGMGKSSLALELISQGHQLIADDVVDLFKQDNSVVGFCPPMLEGLLHTRELGLISIPTVFGQNAWQKQHRIDHVVSLQAELKLELDLTKKNKTYTLLDLDLPLLMLSIHSPASLANRIQCWLKMSENKHPAENQLKQRQQATMSNIKHREHL